MRWQIAMTVCITVVSLAVSVRAEIVLQASDPVDLGVGGLFRFIVSAVGTEGELINRFRQFSVTGDVHQVFRLDPAPTPTIERIGGFAWGADWTPFDSHLLIEAGGRLGVEGLFPQEANDYSTTGTLGLSLQFGQEAPSGFGEITNNQVNPFAFNLSSELVSSHVPFYQVVTTIDGAFLSATIGAEGGIEQRIENFEIGGGDPPMVGELMLTRYFLNEKVAGTVPLTGVVDVLVFDDVENPQYTPGFGANPNTQNLVFNFLPTLTVDGMFMWDTTGAAGGTYVWNITGTSQFGSDSGMIYVEIYVPEPATFALCGLAVVALCALYRGSMLKG
jgi:hypothetical protein